MRFICQPTFAIDWDEGWRVVDADWSPLVADDGGVPPDLYRHVDSVRTGGEFLAARLRLIRQFLEVADGCAQVGVTDAELSGTLVRLMRPFFERPSHLNTEGDMT